MDLPLFASLKNDGWALESGEERHARNPTQFALPSRTARESLERGDAAKLLFVIETSEAGSLVDRGVDRMWVIVKRRAGAAYVGVLSSDPGVADGLTLRPGAEILFGPEHVIEIDHPPREYILEKFGPTFFEE